MFEIGNSLREARLRQGLDLPKAEADTKIRIKYLQALEEENFDLIPADTYVKGFLRTYAEYLGLDGQLYVDEFNSRFATADEPLVRTPSSPRSRHRRIESNFVLVALVGIVAVTVLVVVAWQFGTGRGSPEADLDALIAGETAPAQPPEPAAAEPAPAPPPPAPEPAAPALPARKAATFVLSALNGDCWVRVHAGSPEGELLFEGTLEVGQAPVRFKKKRLVMEVGAGEYLNLKINGRRVKTFPKGAVTVVVTSEGFETVASA